MRSLWIPSGQLRECIEHLRMQGQELAAVSIGDDEASMTVGRTKSKRPDVRGGRRARQLHELKVTNRIISVAL